MRALLLLPALSLAAATPPNLPTLLQKVDRLGTDDLRELQAQLALDPSTSPWRTYHEGHVTYALVARIRAKDPKVAEALLDRTMKSLTERKDPDSQALLGACCGLKIGFAPGSGISLSPKATGLFDEALTRAPANPRVLLFKGIHVLHTPAFFGGGAEKALPLLEAAVKAAEAETPAKDPWQPAWGRSESLGWLAMAQAEAGKQAEAKATCERALALDPKDGFVTERVLPKLQGPEVR